MSARAMPERARRAIAECRRIAVMSEEPNRTTRRFLTPPMREVHALLRERVVALGMTVSVDAAGNLRGLWQPPGARARRLIIGSHIDTVPNAGAFDGILGVTLALECAEIAQELKLPLPIEIIAFSEEEGVRFGVPFIGSRAAAGRFDPSLLKLKDAGGVTLEDAIRAFGLDPGEIEKAAIDADALGFLEIHIEQGPALEAEGLQVAAVTAIVGQTRHTLTWTGHANHAGTTLMHLRRDALAGAAEWIVAVESLAQRMDGLVATVGHVDVEPNAGNVIAGAVRVSLDVRHADDAAHKSAVEALLTQAEAIAHRRNLALQCARRMDQPAVPMDERLTAFLAEAIEATGLPLKRMSSGAGHDAMVMAACVPTAMLFLRSPGGLSHHPDEAVLEEDVAAALGVCRNFLQRLAAEVG
ncbi:MAG TPA: allantoate amidohydrolase [Terracidiphilus sp.]|nr:allantoate amidohydrolase [Terracidiphilus sp.]